MANAMATTSTVQSKQQLQGLFNEMWAVTITISDQDAVAIGDTALFTATVPGVAAGDVVLGWGNTVDASDGTDQAVLMFQVTAANTLTMTVMADAGELAADSLNGGVLKVLIGRPNW